MRPYLGGLVAGSMDCAREFALLSRDKSYKSWSEGCRRGGEGGSATGAGHPTQRDKLVEAPDVMLTQPVGEAGRKDSMGCKNK